MESTSPSEMIKKIKGFVNKLSRKYGEKMMYRIDKFSNTEIRLATDGLLYTLIFDPSQSEMPYLMKEAAEEFGVEAPKVDVWKEQTNLSILCSKNRWFLEPRGGGVLGIYREDN